MAIFNKSRTPTSAPASSSTASPVNKKDSRVKKAWNRFAGWFRKNPVDDQSAAIVEPSAPIQTTAGLSPLPVPVPIAASMTINPSPESDHDDSSYDDDESLESESPKDELARLQRDNITMDEQIKQIKKHTSFEIRRVKAENIAIKKELGQTQKLESDLQHKNNVLLAEIEQLAAKKEAEKSAQDAAIDETNLQYNATVIKITQQTNENSKLEKSMALEMSWSDSLKATLEASNIKSANAQSKLDGEYHQQERHIDDLNRQLTAEMEKTSSILKAKENVTTDLVAARKIETDTAARNKNLAHLTENIKSEITKSTLEINGLENTITLQSHLVDDLAAATQQLVASDNRIRDLENAVVEADEQLKKLRANNKEKIRQLESDLLELTITLSAIREFL